MGIYLFFLLSLLINVYEVLIKFPCSKHVLLNSQFDRGALREKEFIEERTRTKSCQILKCSGTGFYPSLMGEDGLILIW